MVTPPARRDSAQYSAGALPRTFDRLRRVTETAVLENNRLGGLLTLIRQRQQSEPPGMRTSKGPKRRDQTKHLGRGARGAGEFGDGLNIPLLFPFGQAPVAGPG